VTLGTDLNRFYTELRQPIPRIANGNYYLAPYAEYEQRNHDYTINALIEKQPVNILPFAQYQLTTLRAGLDVGIPLARLGELRAGLTYVDYIDRPKSFLPVAFIDPESGNITDNALPTVRSQLFGPRLRLTLDQLDDPIFPRRGYYLYASSETSLLHDGNNYTEAYAYGLWAATVGRHSFNFALEAGGDFNLGSQAQPPGFFLGGFQHLSAYPPNQFSGSYVLYGRATYLTPVVTYDSAFLRHLFFGVSAEAGQVWIDESRFGQGPYQTSYSLFAGLTTGIGPVYFGVAFAPAGIFNVYFQLGRPF
jgi:NTE family protein